MSLGEMVARFLVYSIVLCSLGLLLCCTIEYVRDLRSAWIRRRDKQNERKFRGGW